MRAIAQEWQILQPYVLLLGGGTTLEDHGDGRNCRKCSPPKLYHLPRAGGLLPSGSLENKCMEVVSLACSCSYAGSLIQADTVSVLNDFIMSLLRKKPKLSLGFRLQTRRRLGEGVFSLLVGQSPALHKGVDRVSGVKATSTCHQSTQHR